MNNGTFDLVRGQESLPKEVMLELRPGGRSESVGLTRKREGVEVSTGRAGRPGSCYCNGKGFAVGESTVHALNWKNSA